MIEVTAHAAERYIERVEPALTYEQARAKLLTFERAVTAAAGFGCKVVRLGNGGKLVLDGARVVTVLGRYQFTREHIARFYQGRGA